MKLKLLVAACGLAFGSQAFALSPSATDATTTVKVYLSGSSAQVRVIKALTAADCTAGTPDTYQLSTDTGNVFGISCTLSGTAGGGSGGLGGKDVFIAYNAVGGSANGVYTIAKETIPSSGALNTAQATLLQRPQLTGLSGAGVCTSIGVVAGNPGTTYNCTSTTATYSDAGVSDAEPALFNINLNRPAAWTGQVISPAEFSQINSGTQFQQIFGLAVPTQMWTDLQTMLVAKGDIPAGGNPFLPRSAVASYLAGLYTDPSSGFGWQPLFATSTVAVPAAASGQVNICTRAPGSGTKASSNIFFLGQPNYAASNLTPVTAAMSGPGFVVTEGDSTGAVTSCVAAAATAGQYAIGIVGRENALPANVSWIAIDGTDSGRANVVNGRYDWFLEQSMQWNPTYLSNFKTLPSGITTSQLTNYLTDFRTRSGSPALMATYSATVQEGVAAIYDGVNNDCRTSGPNGVNAKFVSQYSKLGNSNNVTTLVCP